MVLQQMSEVAFKQKLMSVMKDNQYERWIGGKRTGKLDTKRVYRIEQTARIFKKKQERKGKQYNVSLLVDCSGSMTRGGRDRMASEAADKLARGFEAAGVDLEIIGFNTFDHKLKGFNDKYQGLEKFQRQVFHLSGRTSSGMSGEMMYNRDKEQIIPYDPKLDGSYEWDTIHFAQGNCDGKTVHDTVLRLRNRPGTNIVIVLSDGRPSFDIGMNYYCHDKKGKKYNDYNLKGEVDSAIRSGIAFIGIGIQSDDVTEYYPEKNTAVIDDLEEIYPQIINKLSQLIKRG